MKFFPVFKFICDSCSSTYIGETYRHFKTKIEEHIKKDSKSHIFKHLHSPQHALSRIILFRLKRLIDLTAKANSKFDLKIKETLHISWGKPNLNAQQNHLALTFSLQFASPI